MRLSNVAFRWGAIWTWQWSNSVHVCQNGTDPGINDWNRGVWSMARPTQCQKSLALAEKVCTTSKRVLHKVKTYWIRHNYCRMRLHAFLNNGVIAASSLMGPRKHCLASDVTILLDKQLFAYRSHMQTNMMCVQVPGSDHWSMTLRQQTQAERSKPHRALANSRLVAPVQKHTCLQCSSDYWFFICSN